MEFSGVGKISDSGAKLLGSHPNQLPISHVNLTIPESLFLSSLTCKVRIIIIIAASLTCGRTEIVNAYKALKIISGHSRHHISVSYYYHC